MKLRKLTSVLIAAALLISLAPMAFAGRTPSDWFIDEMNDANTNGILTPNVMKDYQRPLTREEFCEMVVVMTERTLGHALALPSSNPFSDTDSDFVLKANLYGIINGTTTTTFTPDRVLTREEVAAMMVRSMQKMEQELRLTLLAPPAASLPFDDANQITDYAVDYMRYAYSNDIMHGSDNNVMPLASITAQECAAAVNRSYNAMKETVYARLSASEKLTRAADGLTIGYAYGDIPSAVSSDVLLPTHAPGGIVVSWSSSAPSIIATSGRVTPSYNARSVTLTATLSVGGQTRSKQFELTTTTQTGDTLLYNNAIANLKIGFWNATDTLESVTESVFLPTTSLGLPVAWSSGSPAVVGNNGRVTPPSGAAATPVTMTARIGTYSKTFSLTVRNAAAAIEGVKLHGVSLGMTSSQVDRVLGTPSVSYSTGYNETWRVYYVGYRPSLVAVAMLSDRVAGVYSMAPNWVNELKNSANATVRAEDVRTANGANVTVYTDASSNRYAAFLYDASTAINTSRSLNENNVEALALDFINAYRALNPRNSAQLISVNQLSRMARDTAAAYSSGSGPQGNASMRAAQYGYESSQFAGELYYYISGAGPQDALQVTSDAGQRSSLLSGAATMIGVGYSGGTRGSFFVIELGAAGVLTDAFASNAPGSTSVSNGVITAGVGAPSGAVRINLLSSGASREPVSIAGSSSYITVRRLSTAVPFDLDNVSFSMDTVDVTVEAASDVGGPAYVVVMGRYSGEIARIPVIIESRQSYASSVSIGGANKNYVTDAGKTLALSAVAAVALSSSDAPAIRWYTEARGVTIRSDGVVTIPGNYTAGSSFTVTAWAPSSASQNTMTTTTAKDTVTIYVPAFTGIPESRTLNLTDTNSFNIPANLSGTLSGITCTFAFSSANENVATVNASGTVTAQGVGTTTITVTANFTGAANTNGFSTFAISRYVDVEVTGTALNPF